MVKSTAGGGEKMHSTTASIKVVGVISQVKGGYTGNSIPGSAIN